MPGSLSSFDPGVATPFLGQTVTPNDLAMWIQDESPEGGSMSWEDSAQTIVYDIPSGFIYGAVLTLIGYAYAERVAVDVNAPIDDPFPPGGGSSTEFRNFCRRGLPLCHPKFPFMICTRIDSWKGIGPRGKEASTFKQEVMQRGLPISAFVSKYEKIRIAATFTQPSYNLFPDSDPEIQKGNELPRFVYRNMGAATQFLTVDKGLILFLDGPYVGKTFTAPGYAQPETTEDIELVWTKVPEDYVCDRFGDPVRFIAALQKVNASEFLGYLPGTLRLDSFHYERFRMPTLFTDGSTRFWCEIKANFKYFNPPYGPSSTLATFANASVTLTVTFGVQAIGLGVNVTGTGIAPNSIVLAKNDTAKTITLSQQTTAASAVGGNVITYDRTIFGHQTGPAGIRKYYTLLVNPQQNAAAGFANIPPTFRFETTEMSYLWYPLTEEERNPT